MSAPRMPPLAGAGPADRAGRAGFSACLLTVLLCCAGWAPGCTDPEARYDAFLERSAEMRGGQAADDAGQPTVGERFDFSGSYVLALSVTLSPQRAILLSAEADVAADLERFALTLQPLAVETDDDPRAPVGESFVVEDIDYGIDGSFEVPPIQVIIPGRANPISGSEIVAEVALSGRAFEAGGELARRLCGQLAGAVSEPLAFDLAGSTFGAVPADDFDPAAPLASCP